MSRHTISVHVLPGVEYETAIQTLFIDLNKYYAAIGPCVDDPYEEPCLFAIMSQWKRLMPHLRVRQYIIKGVGL